MGGTIFAQEISCDSTTWAKPGTYEIIHIEGSTESVRLPVETLANDVLCTIEQSRKLNDTVDLQINPFILIRIYPKNRKESVK